MPRKKPEPTEPPAPQFGELDGEPIDSVIVPLSGAGILDRLPTEGEHALLTIDGTFKFRAIKRINGRLVRELSVSAELMAEPVDQLADEVERFVREVNDKRKGAQELPFDGEPDAGEEPKEGDE